jgi:mono/diheme cytochrome c family protein/glucose/arabinose dehydrogenase
MRTKIIPRVALFSAMAAGFAGGGCRHAKDGRGQGDVLTPEVSMRRMVLQPGFSVRLVASEPLIHTPVAMTFDDKGRIWAVEMSDYEPLNKTDHDTRPLGKIVILTDTDGDGKMDKRQIFLDSMVMPRALCLVAHGILVATPPNLWYYQVDHDRPGTRTLVDSTYTVSGNPEGQTNGLLRGLDNWIYSAGFGSTKRYRYKNGHWLTEKTILRGQWGITQDDYGRLFYNNKSQNLLGDYFLPGLLPPANRLHDIAGYDERIVADNRVYPARKTPGVNRGYKPGTLDDSGRLVMLTAACGPLVYRGGALGPGFDGNAFVAEPAANLVKRDLLDYKGNVVSGRLAYEGKEFLASTDERFRPVNLTEGPDGGLYIVDMYRGVIQDNLSLTDYLKNYALGHHLFKPVDCGRIYEVLPTVSHPARIRIPTDPAQLVGLLASANGWVRDHAQQRLVDDHDLSAVDTLEALLRQKDGPLAAVHALWTLEGLGALKPTDIAFVLANDQRSLKQEALSAMASVVDGSNKATYLKMLQWQLATADSTEAPAVAYALARLYPFAPQAVDRSLFSLVRHSPENTYVLDAVISGAPGREESFLKAFPDTALAFHRRLRKVLERRAAAERRSSLTKLRARYPLGYGIFHTVCQTCHGADGNGIRFQAPPLNGSEWVTGDVRKLLPIVLYGLTGTITVKGKDYRTPDVLNEMPGFGNDDKFSDTALAQLISFIRHAWNNRASDVPPEQIADARRAFPRREQPFTMKELKAMGGRVGHAQ